MDLYLFVFDFCGYLCHQLPLRSPFIGDLQMPLCYRCTGIVLGAISFLAHSHTKRMQVSWALILALPMLIDIIGQYMNYWQSTNVMRIATGMSFGLGAPALVIIATLLIRQKRKGL